MKKQDLSQYLFYRCILKEKFQDTRDLYDIKLIIITSIAVLIIMLFMVLIYKFSVLRYGLILLLLVYAVWKRKYFADVLNLIKK